MTKFEGDNLNRFGQLFLTPDMIANKIKKMKDMDTKVAYTQQTEMVRFQTGRH